MSLKEKIPKEGEIVLCTVKKIIGTSVFCNLEHYNTEAVIPFSEVSPGRIRNIRNYVVPNKIIVCKILRVDPKTKYIDLSLRRVDFKSKKDLLAKFKKEKSFLSILKVILKNKSNEIVEKIKSKYHTIYDFFEKFVGDPKEGKKVGLNDKEIKEIIKLIKERIKEKRYKLSVELELKCNDEDALEKIKKLASSIPDKISFIYESAPKYSLSIIGKDYKKLEKFFKLELEKLEKNAKKLNCKIKISDLIKG